MYPTKIEESNLSVRLNSKQVKVLISQLKLPKDYVEIQSNEIHIDIGNDHDQQLAQIRLYEVIRFKVDS